MVDVSLVEAILREQADPGSSTTRKIRDLYNLRSGENPIVQHSEDDKQFQSILLKALEAFPAVDDEDQPISYTVKLKDSDENVTPIVKRRSIIKLPKEIQRASESDESTSDSEKIPTASSITITKPFSPLFLNNMKKFGVSTDWLAKRSNSVRHSSYSRSSIKSNTNQLDAMIKSASAKPIRSSRKLSFVENATNKPVRLEFDKENADPSEDATEQSKDAPQTAPEPTPYDLSSEVDEDKNESRSPISNAFSLRIPRVNLKNERRKRSSLSSSSSTSSTDRAQQQKVIPKKKRKSKKAAAATPKPPIDKEDTEPTDTIPSDQSKKPSQKKDKDELAKLRIEHLKKLLRIAGIRLIIKKAELEELPSNNAKIAYLKSLFDTAGFSGNLSLKECAKFRDKRDNQKELLEIQATAVDVKGHVKGGRTLRGQARTTDESVSRPTVKRKRAPSTESEDNDKSSGADDNPTVKKRRILPTEASPEVSENEL